MQGHVFHCFSMLFRPSLQDLHSSLPSLPAGWTDQTVTPLNVIQLCKVSRAPCTSAQPVVVTCCLTSIDDLMWHAYVHGHNITPTIASRSPLSSIPTKLTTVSLQALFELLNSCRVCPSHPEKQFEDMAKGKKGKSLSTQGEMVAFVDEGFCGGDEW